MKILFLGTDGLDTWEPHIEEHEIAFVNLYEETELYPERYAWFWAKAKVFESFTMAMDIFKPQIGAIGVANFRKNRPNAEIDLLHAGADLYVYKFRLADYGYFEEILRTAAQSGRRVLIGEQYRHLPEVRAARQVIESGYIGIPELIFWDCSLDLQDLCEWEKSYTYLAVEDLALHHFSALESVIGFDVREVYAKLLSPVKSRPITGSAEISTITFKNGVVLSHIINWHNSGRDTSYFGEVSIEGEKGAVIINPAGVKKKLWGQPEQAVPVGGEAFDPVRAALEIFENGKKMSEPPDIERFAKIIRTIAAAVDSSENKRVVFL